jgi:acyl-CoA synthetase (AMP-forming)/AMP-acid ligase II
MSGINVLKELNRYKIGTCAEMVYRNALFYPDRECLVFEDTRITFSAFNSGANQLANALKKMGLKKGDVVGILSWNSPKYLEISAAAMKGGFIISPFNARLNEKELSYLVEYSQAKVIFVGEEHMDMARTLRSMGLSMQIGRAHV